MELFLRLMWVSVLLTSQGVHSQLEFSDAFEPAAAAASTSNLWPNPGYISVCWERPGFSIYKAYVRQEIANTWSFYSSLRFTGWGDCTNRDTDIRIGIVDQRAQSFVGTDLRNRRNGMILNFEFKSFPCYRTHLECLLSTAVHEFGHAIGLVHEQDRPDNPDEDCRTKHWTNGFSFGDQYITIYDPNSVMNYCNDDWIKGMSPLDKQAVANLYPKTDCLDSHKLCPEKADSCLTTDADEQEWLRYYCPGTCSNLCIRVVLYCLDSHNLCPEKADSCLTTDTDEREWLRYYCPGTCSNLCT